MSLDRGWHTVVCAASGPSIDSEQAAVVAQAQAAGRCRVIVVNDTWRLLPTADALYACDGAWWKVHIEAVRAGFAGELWTQDHAASVTYGLNWVRVVKHEKGMPPLLLGQSREPDALNAGGSSGYQAIGLAVLFGATRIILVGYDAQRTNGKAHWFGDHPAPLSQGNPAGPIKRFVELSKDATARGLKIVNCSRETALTCFPRSSLIEALAQ